MPGYEILSSPWWVPVLWVIVLGHLTNICNTLYLHRSATHGGVEFHPVVEHLMRFWLWLTTGIVTKEWVAVHRKHHAYADREGDPHSPTQEGLANILFMGLFFYQRAANDEELLEKYGRGTPDDWIERHVYSTKLRSAGVALVLLADMWLFGWAIGLIVWSFMAIWVPIMGNIINGIGHALGYRNFGTKDDSHNIYPWGIWILGEELHNNHHADPRSAKFRARWWEFDIGWIYIKVLAFLRLANVVYARSASAREFAAKYYTDKVAQPVAEKLESAGERLQRAREEGRAKLDHARDEAIARLEKATADARARLDQVRTEGRERLESARAEGRARYEKVRSEVREEIARARAEARTRIEQAQAALESLERRPEPEPARD